MRLVEQDDVLQWRRIAARQAIIAKVVYVLDEHLHFTFHLPFPQSIPLSLGDLNPISSQRFAKD